MDHKSTTDRTMRRVAKPYHSQVEIIRLGLTVSELFSVCHGNEVLEGNNSHLRGAYHVLS